MTRVAEVAEVSGKIARSDKNTVDALDCGDGFDVFQRLACFDLNEDAEFARGLCMVILDTAETRGA